MEEAVDRQRMNVLGRCVLVGEGQVLLEQRANVVAPGIVELDDDYVHPVGHSSRAQDPPEALSATGRRSSVARYVHEG